MRKRLQEFDADRDQGDSKKAAELFKHLWPSRVQIACANRLADSIHAANDEADASWEVSMFAWGIRLNVGQVASLDFASDEVVAVIMSPRSKPVYSAVPVGSDVLRFAPEKISAVSPRQWDSHDQFIQAAASAKKKSPFKSSFSEGVMKHIESVLGRDLPRPSYLVRSLHILQGGVDNRDKAWLEKAAKQGLRRSAWIAPKSARIGDDAVIYVAGFGFFATARIAGSPRPRTDWVNRYGAALDSIDLIDPPVSLGEIRKKLPKLDWAKYPRSVHSLTEKTAFAVRALIAERRKNGRSDISFESFPACTISSPSLLEDIKEIERDPNLRPTERRSLILARLGQGQFRADLIRLWQGCAVTGCRAIEVLLASHIKPWKKCSSRDERLNVFNGLLLMPNLDALFDKALISFDHKGQILISKLLPKEHWESLKVSKQMKFSIKPQHQPYLSYHRNLFDQAEKAGSYLVSAKGENEPS
jgi:hypothetical protein